MSARKRRRLLVSVEAERDLEDIAIYTEGSWGIEQRDRYLSDLLHGLEMLRDHPELGRARDELYAGCRSLLIEHHIALYYVTDDAVVIDQIFHSSRDITTRHHP